MVILLLITVLSSPSIVLSSLFSAVVGYLIRAVLSRSADVIHVYNWVLLPLQASA